MVKGGHLEERYEYYRSECEESSALSFLQRALKYSAKVNGALRFAKYCLVGGSTFLLDLILLFIFTHSLGWSPVMSSGFAYFIAVSVYYILSRKLVFQGTLRGVGEGYLGFMLIAGAGVATVTIGMHLLVTILEWQYLLSRLIVAVVTGMWNYLLNLYVNFRVAGTHIRHRKETCSSTAQR